MDLPTVLLRDLSRLAVSIGLGEHDLRSPLAGLVSALRSAVDPYRGLKLTIVQRGYPITLTEVGPVEDHDHSVATTLRIHLLALGQGHHPESRIIFYAGTPGALVDLAADLAHALKTPPGDEPTSDDLPGDGHQDPLSDGSAPLLVLDADLPSRALVSGFTGLAELAAIDRAVGIMIAQGHHPDDAHDKLRRDAAAANVETHVHAAQLLRRHR